MSLWIETVNSALFNNVKTPFFILATVFAVILILTIAFAIYENKNDIP
ncbi:MAG: hypothetical protein ACI4GC_08995 [Acutalibacteraceae bacterium]